MVTIADCALGLAATIRRRIVTTDPDSPARLPFSGSNSARAVAAIHPAIDKLDYVVHGHSLGRYVQDSETWRKQGWPFSIARWVVATPGDAERPEIVRQRKEEPPILGTCTDTWGWTDDVMQPYQAIFQGLATVKLYFGHMPVFAINTWAGSADWLRHEVALPGLFDAEALGPLLDYWFKNKWCRQVLWGTDLSGPRRGDPRRRPPEIEASGTFDNPNEGSGGLPIEWMISVEHFAEALKRVVRSQSHDSSDDNSGSHTVGHVARIASSGSAAGRSTEMTAMEVAMSEPVRDQVFISYSHKDARWRDDLLTHLKPYLRDGSITAWSDKDIQPGSRWLNEIRQALAQTRVAVLLVTPHFLASDFIHEHELTPFLNQAVTGGVTILWIPVRASSYLKSPIRDYQAMIDAEKPLASMRANRDKAWVEICQAIENAVKRLSDPSRDDIAPIVTGQVKPALLRDLERSIVDGELQHSLLGRIVLEALREETELELASPYDPSWITTGVRRSDEVLLLVSQSAGHRDWQEDFAQTATPILVGAARTFERSADAQALIMRLCELVVARLRLTLIWPDDPDESNNMKNAIYRACLDATEVESDTVLAELQRVHVVGPE